MKHDRKSSKKNSFPLFLIKLVIGGLLFGGLIYGVSFSISEVSDMTLSELVDKTPEPISSVAGKYADKVPNLLDSVGKKSEKNEEPLLQVALMGDSHNDNDNLKKALDLVKKEDINNVIFLGDFSAVGSMEELEAAKKVLEESGVTYWTLPGDHDLYSSAGTGNYEKVFGKRYESFEIKGIKFILSDNSDNEIGVDQVQLNWFTDQLSSLKNEDVAFVFFPNPLYNDTSFKLMGENSESVKQQSQVLMSLIQSSTVKAVFAGDNHISSRSKDPKNENLEHIVVGALTKSRNLQSPRFDIFRYFEDGSYDVKEVLLDAALSNE